MSQDGRYNQGNFGGGWRDAPSSDAELEQRYSQQGQNQQPMNPDQALLMGALQDPTISSQLAQDIRNRLMGQGQNNQQNQQPAPKSVVDVVREEIATLETKSAELRQVDASNRDYSAIYELDRQVQEKKIELVSKENEHRYRRQQAQQNNQQAQQIFSQFVFGTIGKLPMSDEEKMQIGQEFTYQLRSSWSQEVLSDPQRLQQILPESYGAFAWNKGLPRPDASGNYNAQNAQAARQGESFNNATQPPAPAPDPSDPLAGLAQMNDHERAMLKAYYYTKGDYSTADKITNRDGTPVQDRRNI